MTLATRCPTCGTVFRVVQDQLRVSQGWVRCGRCSEAFNALRSMVEVPTALNPEPRLDPSAAPFPATDFGPTAVMEWPDAAGSPATPSAPPTPLHGTVTTESDSAAYVLEDPPAAAPAAGSLLDLPIGLNLIASDGAVMAAPLPEGHERTEPVYAVDEATAPVDVLSADPPGAETAHEPFMVMALATPPAAGSATLAGSQAETPARQASDRAPSFLVRAERAERWRRPGVRLALSALVLLGTMGLVAQLAHAFRDRIVASAPALRPVLQQACAALDCTVGDFRQIESLSVESSGLVRVEGAPVYRLAVTLRNRSQVELAAPALDLALTDAQGKPIARRVFQMSDLYLPLRTLKAGSELPIQVPLGISDRPVSGYTVEIFYP